MKATATLALTLLAASLSTAHAASLPGVERNTAQFLKAIEGGKPLNQMTPEEARAVLVGAQAGSKVALAPADVSQKTVTLDGKPVQLTIVRPAGARGKIPAFMFFHGGGWVLGDYPTHERLVRDLVAGSGAAAVFVNYTPSPEAGYGVALKQAYAATRWVAENGDAINVDGKRLAVAGNSVGGNMAAVVSLMAKDQGAPKLRAQLLMWPVTDANFETPSYRQFADGHFLTRDLMVWFWDHYTRDAGARKEIYASPLQATSAQLQGLPPTLIQTAEFDVLRDEGEAYARKLDAAGVEVKSVRYNGMIHDFGLLNALATLPATRSALEQASQELKLRLK
ncbi:alpha/beta hydrolase [Massilia sp. CCM 9210]|uniref:alpha/beta hydrolase n=1 Tax=Massilia scottii TaxID=3057166 RepID=UPI002796C63C|nr:alpha/beta hydrolase [Massilia sp. CCM 9210]MDQ1817046.1 alpha/beta hydrolase [Massilia sp. CCM 9210]